MRNDFGVLWALQPEAIPTVLHLLTRDAGLDMRPATTTWEAAAPATRLGSGGQKSALIPIQGILTQDGPSYLGTNYETIASAAEKAAADPDVKRIILDVDSPGGTVTGLQETAAVIAAVAKVKPVSAIVSGTSASAAYWLTSQASDITLTPSGAVGSVGVRTLHADMSGALEKAGISVTEIHSGDYKTEQSPYKPLSGAAKADIQRRMDASYAEFLNAVTRGRGQRASLDLRRSNYGQGRMLSASDALAGGLVDKVQSTREFLKGLGGASAAAMPFHAASYPMTSVHRARLELEQLRRG